MARCGAVWPAETPEVMFVEHAADALVTLDNGRPVPEVIHFGAAKAMGQKPETTLFTT